MKNLVPEKAKSAARDLVARVVRELRKKLETDSARAIRGALNRNEHSPFRSLPYLDWPRTIRCNLKNYNESLGMIIPHELSFFSRRYRQNKWNVIIVIARHGQQLNNRATDPAGSEPRLVG